MAKEKFIQNLQKIIPYFFIVVLIFFTLNFSKILINNNFSDYYGKPINKLAYNFNLKSVDDKIVNLSQFKGEYVFLTFGFTKCNGVCPLNLSRFKQISDKLSSEDRLNFIFISIDEVRDSKKSLQSYLERFKIKNIKGLVSGDDSSIEVAKEYKNFININFEKLKSESNYQIDHNGFLYLVNPEGFISLIYMQKNPNIQKIINDIKMLKREKV